jgi:hypothetical protein
MHLDLTIIEQTMINIDMQRDSVVGVREWFKVAPYTQYHLTMLPKGPYHMNSSYSRCLKELMVQRGASSLAFLTTIRGEIGGKVNAKVVNVLSIPVKMSLSFKTLLVQSGPSRKK